MIGWKGMKVRKRNRKQFRQSVVFNWMLKWSSIFKGVMTPESMDTSIKNEIDVIFHGYKEQFYQFHPFQCIYLFIFIRSSCSALGLWVTSDDVYTFKCWKKCGKKMKYFSILLLVIVVVDAWVAKWKMCTKRLMLASSAVEWDKWRRAATSHDSLRLKINTSFKIACSPPSNVHALHVIQCTRSEKSSEKPTERRRWWWKTVQQYGHPRHSQWTPSIILEQRDDMKILVDGFFRRRMCARCQFSYLPGSFHCK